MKDKILLFQSPLADFCIAPWGSVIYLGNGRFDLDHKKAFNRQRRNLHAGGNMSRILRSPRWGVPVGQEFDYKHPDYFPVLRKYLEILHNPCQGTPKGQGARVVIEPFDGCSEKHWYDKANYEEARKLQRTFFAQTADLDFVDIGAGNEMNDQDDSLALFRDVIIPEFDKVGKIPFSYGATYSVKHGDKLIVAQKQEASKKWGDDTSFAIYKQVHGCWDKLSENFVQAVKYWARHPMCTFFSVDGCKNSKSPCDFYQDQVRPSPVEFMEMVKYVLDYINAGLIPTFLLETGQPKIAVEFISKVWDNDQCGALPIIAASELYKKVFGVYPFNWGKYPNDWVEPPSPGPDPTPEPPPPGPPVQIKPCSYFWKRHNYWHWLRCIFCGKH